MIRKIALVLMPLLPAVPVHGELRVFPAQITLQGSGALQSIVCQTADAGGRTTDVTANVKVSLSAPLAAWDAARATLTPIADGDTSLTVELGAEKATVPVKVQRSGQAREPSFRLDVEPLFMRAGCNSGSCHGSGRGQDGFRLSLFGYDPAGDYFRVTRELPGRRVDLAAPEKSLLLEKATGAVTHTGGECFKPDSDLYRTLHGWIAAGAPDDAPDTPVVTGIRLLPDRIMVRADAANPPAQRMLVMADYSDGSQRDVTSLALYLTNAEAVAAVGKDGEVQFKASGGAHVFARFDKFTTGTEAIVLPDRDGFAWPAGMTPANYVDEAVFSRLKRLQIVPSGLCDDLSFLRRVSLDLTGLPPTEEQVAAFTADTDPDKRIRLTDRLLASPEFTDILTMKWAEVLQIKGSNNVVNGRSRKAAWKYHQSLKDSLAANRPFNEIVRELIRGEGSNLTTPAANYYISPSDQRRTPMERAEDTAQLFLGTRIQCAQCHNHPFDRWTMDDYYGFTAFFTGVNQKKGMTPNEFFVFADTGKATIEHPVDGRRVPPRFLGGAEPDLAGKDPRHFLADWLTAADNAPFARSVANRLWAHLFGRGIIEPVDDARISNPPSNEDLLSVLAEHFAASDFDLRRLVRDICSSRTYQLSSTANESNAADDRFFSRSRVRRLQAEVLLDTVNAAAGVTPSFNGQPAGTRAVQIFDGGVDKDYFIKTFGASRRETVCTCEVRMEPTLTQTLHLLNGNTVDGALSRSPFLRSITAEGRPAEENIRRIYLRSLGRQPSAPELAKFLAMAESLPAGDKTSLGRFYEDVMWSLFNSTEFAFNH